MAITIYGISASRASRPLWAAHELGLPFQHEPVPFREGATRTPEFLSLNPNGHIPALKDARADGDVVVWESMACVLYLARVHGAADGQGIAPACPAEEADALRWAFWAVTEVEKDALCVLFHRIVLPVDQRKPEVLDAAVARLQAPLTVLEQHLQQQQAKACAYVAASRFTVADLVLASVLAWAKPAAALFEQRPLLSAWLDACLARPAHQAVRQMSRQGV
jgi:glutathione S-transferase